MLDPFSTPQFEQATKAFQELVRAFEGITSPEPTAAAAKKGKAEPTLARSNQNCFRTRLWCPRCGAEWATADAGVESAHHRTIAPSHQTPPRAHPQHP